MRNRQLSHFPARSIAVSKTRSKVETRLTRIERADCGDAPAGSAQLDALRRLAERVIRDAEDVAARIDKAVLPSECGANRGAGVQPQSEAAARRQADLILEEARQKAVAIVAEATKEAAQARLMAKEDIDRHLAEVMGKIRNELRPSLDFMVGRVKTLEEGIQSFAADPNNGYIGKSQASSSFSEESPDAFGLDRLSGEAAESKRPGPAEHLSGHQDDKPEAQTGGALMEGKIEIKVAPPVDMVRLLGITRYLESTRSIKVVQTAGSWDMGSVITLSVDKPLPLVDLLKRMPGLGEAKLAIETDESSGTERGGANRILVTLKNERASNSRAGTGSAR